MEGGGRGRKHEGSGRSCLPNTGIPQGMSRGPLGGSGAAARQVTYCWGASMDPAPSHLPSLRHSLLLSQPTLLHSHFPHLAYLLLYCFMFSRCCFSNFVFITLLPNSLFFCLFSFRFSFHSILQLHFLHYSLLLPFPCLFLSLVSCSLPLSLSFLLLISPFFTIPSLPSSCPPSFIINCHSTVHVGRR